MAPVMWPTFGSPTLPSSPLAPLPSYQPPNSKIGTVVPGQQGNGGPVSTPNGAQSALDFLGTPGGAAVTNFAGGALSAYGQYQQQQQQLKQNASQFAATTLQNQYNTDQGLQAQKAAGLLSADPLGAEQKYAQRNALLNAILPNLRNTQSTPGDSGVAAAMGQHSGGIMNALPQNGLDPAMVNSMFGPQATASAIGQRSMQLANLDPSVPTTDLTQLYGAQGAGPQAQVQQFAQQLQSKQGADRAAYEQQLNTYIQLMAKQEQGGGFWHTLAKIAGVVGAGVATIMTAGGASPLLAGVIGAGSGAASSWGNGAGPMGTLLGAGMGGAAAYTANANGESGDNSGSMSLSNVLGTSAKNPALASAILGRR